MPREVIAGGPAHWIECGQGAPALLLHCALAHSGAWAGVMSELADCLHMTAMDLPGHGQTAWDDTSDLQGQAVEIAVALLERLSGPGHLIGHSFGATVALRVAVERPDLAASLTLIEPVYFVLLHDAGHPAYAQHLERGAAFAEALDTGDKGAATRAFLAEWGGMQEDLPERQWRYMVDRIHLIKATENAIVFPDRGPRLHLDAVRGIRCPVVLIEGNETSPTIHAILDVIARAVPQATRHLIDGAGHMAPISHPGAVAGRIRAVVQC